MHCTNCGAEIQSGFKFCASCGKPVPATVCPGCGNSIKPDARFCTNCGTNLSSESRPAAAPPAPPPAAAPIGIASDLRSLEPGETVLMDTGRFPISYIKNIMTSINGKLYLTNKRIVFKAVALQGAGVMPSDSNKSKTFFAIPLNQVTSVNTGWANLIVHAGEDYKFGGMRKTREWADAINRAKVSG